MSMWNHRVLRRDDPIHGDWYGIYEVYYDDEGRPEFCTQDPVGVCAESIVELRKQLAYMKMCAWNTEPLEYKDFEKEGEYWKRQLNQTEELELLEPKDTEKPKTGLKGFLRKIRIKLALFLLTGS